MSPTSPIIVNSIIIFIHYYLGFVLFKRYARSIVSPFLWIISSKTPQKRALKWRAKQITFWNWFHYWHFAKQNTKYAFDGYFWIFVLGLNNFRMQISSADGTDSSASCSFSKSIPNHCFGVLHNKWLEWNNVKNKEVEEYYDCLCCPS